MEGVGGDDDGVCGWSLNEVGGAASQADGRGRALALPGLGGAEGRAALLPSRPLRPGGARAGRQEASLSALQPRAAGGQQRGGVAAGERHPGDR